MFKQTALFLFLSLPAAAVAMPEFCPVSIARGGSIRIYYSEQSIFNISNDHGLILRAAFDTVVQECEPFSDGPLIKVDSGRAYNVRIESVDLGKLDFIVTQRISKTGVPGYLLQLNSRLNFDLEGLVDASQSSLKKILTLQNAHYRR